MRNIIILLCTLAFIGGFSIFEQIYVTKSFKELENKTVALIEKTKDLTAEENDITETMDWWQEKKNSMHIYIPHDVISNIDYYLAEAQGLLVNDNYQIALSKLTIVLDMAKSIPLTFKFKISNIL